MLGVPSDFSLDAMPSPDAKSDPPQAAGLPPWPDVPACYGWLSLDRRGAWRLKGEVVRHAGLVGFLNRNYGCEADGCWLVRNGPQRVYVGLDYAPWVFRLDGGGALLTHAGRDAGAAQGVWFDEAGNVLIAAAVGPGLLDDRDLAAFLAECVGAGGDPADEAGLLAAMSGGAGVVWRGLAVGALRGDEVPARFGFRRVPEP